MAMMLLVPLLMWQRALTMRSHPSAAPKAVTAAPDATLPVMPTGLKAPSDRLLTADQRPSLSDRWAELLDTTAARTAAWDRPLGLLWLAMSVLLALRTWRSTVLTARRTRALHQQHIGAATVHVSDDIGPAAFGGSSPGIVLPRWILELDASLLDLVIMHEQEHLRARDPRLLLFGVVCLVLMPWNAALWWAWRRLRLAIEIDCDARVLRGASTPRSYAQLLLFISQRRSQHEHARVPYFPAPLMLAFNPQGRHLKRRISAMTAHSRLRPARVLLIATALGCSGSLAFAIPAPRAVRSREPSSAPIMPAARNSGEVKTIVVNVTRLGLELDDTPVAGKASMQIVLYGEGPVRIGIGGGALRPLTDTLRLDHLPAFSADVTSGSVHIEMRQVRGTLELGGDVAGGPMTTFSVRARHVVFAKGGSGVRGLPATSDGASGTSRSSSVSRSAPARTSSASSKDQARILADSLAVRITLAELRYNVVRMRYSDNYPLLLDTERQFDSMQKVLDSLPPSARARVRTIVQTFLTERRTKLGLDRTELLTKYSPTFPTITEIERETELLDARLKEIKSARAFAVAPRR